MSQRLSLIPQTLPPPSLSSLGSPPQLSSLLQCASWDCPAASPQTLDRRARSLFRTAIWASLAHLCYRRHIMATNGNQETFAPDDVLAAVMTMRGGEPESKKKAHEYLERFQKSVRGWSSLQYLASFADCFPSRRTARGPPFSAFYKRRQPQRRLFSLPSPSVARLELPQCVFARTCRRLPEQITYDVSTQVPPSELSSLRDQILLLLQRYSVGPKPIRVQLCVCLAILAIQMKDWNDVLPSVVNALGNSPESHAAILDFVRVLPEEVTEGRKITLSVCGTRTCRPNNHPLRRHHDRRISSWDNNLIVE